MNIYLLKNFTLREQYLGATEDDSFAAVKAHKGNADSPVSHWKWGAEKIQWGEVQAGLAPVSASAFLKALRNEPLEEGWVNVYGGADLAPEEDVSAEDEEWLPPPED
jgi:hypothetical protein